MPINYSYIVDREQHSNELHAGLLMLGPEFNARICPICSGKTEYEQTYTAGCGGGYFKSMGRCDYCDGLGMMQGDKAAPPSVVFQVINAGKAFLGVKNENPSSPTLVRSGYRRNHEHVDWMR
jgi:hypothetical protein